MRTHLNQIMHGHLRPIRTAEHTRWVRCTLVSQVDDRHAYVQTQGAPHSQLVPIAHLRTPNDRRITVIEESLTRAERLYEKATSHA